MAWTTPACGDLRFGFEITMHIAALMPSPPPHLAMAPHENPCARLRRGRRVPAVELQLLPVHMVAVSGEQHCASFVIPGFEHLAFTAIPGKAPPYSPHRREQVVGDNIAPARQEELDMRRHQFLRRAGRRRQCPGLRPGPCHGADAPATLLQQHGITQALVDGGEWAGRGRNPAGQPWHLALADPRDAAAWINGLDLQEACLATSADNPSCFPPDFRHHHILDPRSGDLPPEVAEVAVLAREGALADAFTKVAFMAGPRRAVTLAREWSVELLLVDKAGRRWVSPGWPGLTA
ncbi:hypothetical protein GCM10009107_40640 [Ideonella azotifigens]|uniref:Coenzyme PQQ synthesis protein A n=2 Tax=Ideonella azotifigens TaxID=513160 RepID=A0ABN1K9J9_9BURK